MNQDSKECLHKNKDPQYDKCLHCLDCGYDKCTDYSEEPITKPPEPKEERHWCRNDCEVCEPKECLCACHENKLKKPYEHTGKCCEDLNGFVEPEDVWN